MDDEAIPQPKRKIGLKINNKVVKDTISPQKKLETAALSHVEAVDNYKDQMLDLAIKFKAMIHDQVLPENKGPLAQNVEQEILSKLISLASTMNDDPNQSEGVGSNSLCMLLLKCMLFQRDKINELSFKISKLEESKNTKST